MPIELVPLIKGGYRQGVTTSCIGFDDGYDEQLLAALADGGMGNDYWCAGPDQAAQVFADEFGGLASVVAQNVSVEIAPSDAVAATAVLNEFPITDLPGHRVQVALGDAYGSERRKLVAKFHLRPDHDGRHGRRGHADHPLGSDDRRRGPAHRHRAGGDRRGRCRGE